MPATRTPPRTSRTSAKKKPTPKKKPAARGKARSRSSKQGFVFEQRHFDLIGLGLIAAAVFLGFVLYRDRDGGEAGRKLVDGLTWLGGDMAFGVPVALG